MITNEAVADSVPPIVTTSDRDNINTTNNNTNASLNNSNNPSSRSVQPHARTPGDGASDESTTTTVPATPVIPIPPADPDSEGLPKYKRDLVAKQRILRAELQALQPQSGHCRLEVSRGEIFEVCTVHSMFHYLIFYI